MLVLQLLFQPVLQDAHEDELRLLMEIFNINLKMVL